SGYRLLAVVGPDSAPQAWLERWRLLDIFAVLLIATVAWRLLGVPAALVALGAAVLTYQEHGAPIWLWLAVLVLLALERAAPAGRLPVSLRGRGPPRSHCSRWRSCRSSSPRRGSPSIRSSRRSGRSPTANPSRKSRSCCSTRPRARAWRETSAPGQVAPRSAPCQRRPRSCRSPRSP